MTQSAQMVIVMVLERVSLAALQLEIALELSLPKRAHTSCVTATTRVDLSQIHTEAAVPVVSVITTGIAFSVRVAMSHFVHSRQIRATTRRAPPVRHVCLLHSAHAPEESAMEATSAMRETAFKHRTALYLPTPAQPTRALIITAHWSTTSNSLHAQPGTAIQEIAWHATTTPTALTTTIHAKSLHAVATPVPLHMLQTILYVLAVIVTAWVHAYQGAPLSETAIALEYQYAHI